MSDNRHPELRVLVLAPFGKDANLIKRVLRQAGVNASTVANVPALALAISEDAGCAVVSEEVLRDDEINVLAHKLANQPTWSDFPIIVLTGGGISTHATELAVRSRAPLGNVSLLERPLRPATLISAVRSAIAARQRQYEVRDHLLERQQAEDALRRAHGALESLVEQRTTALRRLSARLLRVQDEERRRIARELHDSLGQYLTAAKINLDLLARSDHKATPQLCEARELIDRAISDVRTLSHLLHPPLLDEAGFVSAAKWYVEGFGKRSGIRAELEISENFLRLAPEFETALFRVLQEALTNVHRHSRSSSVEVRLTKDPSAITLTIQDHGVGMPPETLHRFRENGTSVGVGLAGMRERIKELSGTLNIESSPRGTFLKVAIPLAPRERENSATNLNSPSASFHTVVAHP
ncbi:MAG: ATP-binding protein [Acidobacteria bacterium]|nr:ATP-binding protein [Acidobacteriota bacterium]